MRIAHPDVGANAIRSDAVASRATWAALLAILMVSPDAAQAAQVFVERNVHTMVDGALYPAPGHPLVMPDMERLLSSINVSRSKLNAINNLGDADAVDVVVIDPM